MDGNDDENFLKLCIKTIAKITLKNKNTLNEQQCMNLLSHFQKRLYMLQDVMGPHVDCCGPLWKDLFRIVSKASLLLESCQRDDWCQVVLIQNSNKEAFRELLLELEAWFHTISLQVSKDPLISSEQMEEFKLSTTLCPTEVDEIENDHVSLQKRLANVIKMHPCISDNFKVAKYLLDLMGCLSKVEEGDLNTSQFPTEFHCPQWGHAPQTLGDAGRSSVHVYATTWLGLSTATKVTKVENMEMKKYFEKEALILAGLHHPNIAKFFYCGYLEDTKDLLFGMEKGERNLSDMLFLGQENITYAAKLDIMLQVASGMYYLHDMKVAHRDLKPANVIITSLHVPELDNDGYVVAKLVDFGTAKVEVKETPKVPTGDYCFGTSGYIAPEAMKMKPDEKMAEVDALKVDVFSFGVLCYEVSTQTKSPFVGLNRNELCKRLKDGKEQIMSSNVPLELRILIEECWSFNPSKRPIFSNLHERLTNIKRTYLVAMSTKHEVSHPPMLDVEGWFENLVMKFLMCLKWLAHMFCAMLPILSHGWWQGYMRIVFNNPMRTSSHQVNDKSRSLKPVVGFERRFSKFEKKLGKSHMLGIVGMGGVGKTTFVKALMERYQKGLKENISSHKVKSKISMDDVSFAKVEAVKGSQLASFDKIVFLELSKINISDKDIHLQIMSYILQSLNFQENPEDLEQATKILLKILSKRNVLLILDDVGGAIQLDLLLTSEMFNVGGSKLIATSRDWDKLKCVMKDTSSKVVLHTLDDDQSMKLLSKHAFTPSQCACPPYLQQLSKKIVKACGGLPLSLEVIGSHLCGKTRIRIWERALQRLLKANLEDGDDDMKLWKTLRISFDALLEEEKKMFLDIACYFCKDVEPEGVQKHIALQLWNESFGNAEVLLSSLVNKSLVRVEDDGTLNMHDQLRDIGRMLSKTEFGDARKWNWSMKSINEYTFKGFHNVEGLCFVGNHEDFRQSYERKVQLTNLRILSYKSCTSLDMICSLVKESEELRWLSIKFSEGSDKCINTGNHMFSKLVEHNKMENLLVLVIMDSSHLRSFPENAFNLTSLRSLTIQRCEWMETLDPTIRFLQRLDSIILKQCKRLKNISHEMKNLVSLTILNVYECPMLTNLPQDLGNLTSLRTLNLSGCKALQGLSLKDSKVLQNIPQDLGNLTSLTTLSLQGCEALEAVPPSLCKLKSLQGLSLMNCKVLKELPHDLGNLTSLTELDLEGCEALEAVPASVCKLKSLEELWLMNCKVLKEIPKDLGNLTSLTKLDLSGCEALEAVPESICKLKSLQDLWLKDCKVLKELPQDLGNLTSLTKLSLSGCEALEAVPTSVCKLNALEGLWLMNCKALKKIPEDLGNLTSLTTLDLEECEALEAVPASVCKLKSLEELWLMNCKVLKEIPKDLGNLTSLTKLDLSGCEALEAIPESICKLKSLQELWLQDCKVLKELPQDLENLTSLTTLDLSGCEALEAVPTSVCKLNSLEGLWLMNCKALKKIPEDLGNLTSLTTLDLEECEALEAVPASVCKLKSLEELWLMNCKVLKEIPKDLGNLTSLTKLDLSGCEALEAVPESICKLKSLQELWLQDCKVLKELPQDLGNLTSLTTLDLKGCEALEGVPPSLCKLKSLQELWLKDCKVLKELPHDLGNLTSLTKLDLSGCEALEALPTSVCKLNSLEGLWLMNCKALKKIPEDLGNLTSLTTLDLSRCEALEAVPESICKLKSLQLPCLKDCKVLKELLQDLENLTSLRELCLSGYEALEAVPESICKLKSLQQKWLKD